MQIYTDETVVSSNGDSVSALWGFVRDIINICICFCLIKSLRLDTRLSISAFDAIVFQLFYMLRIFLVHQSFLPALFCLACADAENLCKKSTSFLMRSQSVENILCGGRSLSEKRPFPNDRRVPLISDTRRSAFLVAGYRSNLVSVTCSHATRA